MNQSRHFFSRLLLPTLLVFVSAAGFANAQSARVQKNRKAISYAFVSPNTRENLTLQEAIAGLGSPEEKRLIEESRLVVCRLHLAARVRKALGSWTDGAENSTVLQARTDQSTIQYAASSLGKFARQKTVLYFHRRRFGEARMYVLFLPRGDLEMAAVAAELNSDGVANRTLVPRRRRMLIYIVDLKNELKEPVLKAARRLHARLSSFRGAAGFIGDDNDRDKARAIFEQQIKSYEATHSMRRTCRRKTAMKISTTMRPLLTPEQVVS